MRRITRPRSGEGRAWLIGLTALLALAAVMLAWGMVRANGDGGSSPAAAGDEADGRLPTPTATPAILEAPDVLGARDPAEHLDELPAAAAASVRAWLAADVDAIVASAPSRTVECQAIAVRGGSYCELTGRPVGTLVTLLDVMQESGAGFEPELQAVRDDVAYQLVGRNPRLILLAERSDGVVLAVVGIDPRPQLTFPSGADTGGGDGVATYVKIDGDGRLIDFGTHGAGSPPLEAITYEERHMGVKYRVIAAADEFREWNDAWHAGVEADRRSGPGR